MQQSVRICAVGDLIGRPGRRCLAALLPRLRATYAPDLLIVNGENSAGGFGITAKVFRELTRGLGVDVVTTGNHWQDKKEIFSFGPSERQLLLPANMYNVDERERGYHLGETRGGVPYAVVNLTGCLFMKGDNRSPFVAADEIIAAIPPEVRVRVVDFHAEATSEKQALAHYLTGRVSLLYGTHTHCPTADERILGGHTGYATDVGMTGGYDSVIGVRAADSLALFLGKAKVKFEPAKGDPWLCALVADVDVQTGACRLLERLRWRLAELDE